MEVSPTKRMINLNDIVALVKQLLEQYLTWIADPDVSTMRICCCGCLFRHRHDKYYRGVVLPEWEQKIPILRLKCPQCARTESIIPLFLRRNSPYPWLLQQAAILHYLTGQKGYRPVAKEAGIDWQLLWQWVDFWAKRSHELYKLLSQDILTFAPQVWEDVSPTDEEVFTAKVHAPKKRLGMAWFSPVIRLALNLWRAVVRHFPQLGLPVSHHALAFLAAYYSRAAPLNPT